MTHGQFTLSDGSVRRGLVRIIGMAISLLSAGPLLSAFPVPPGIDETPMAPPGEVMQVRVKELPDAQRRAIENFQAARLAETARALSTISKQRSAQFAGAYVGNMEEGYVNHLDGLLRKVLPGDKVEGKLKVALSRLEGRAFDGLQLRGYFPEGPERKGPWTRMSRLLTSADGSVVSISEWNFSADGVGVVVYPEYATLEIAGNPAELVVSIAPSGRELWVLSWSTTAKNTMLLLAPAPGVRDVRERIVDMALALARS